MCSASHEFVTSDLFGGLSLAFAVWIVAPTGDGHCLFGGRRDIVESLDIGPERLKIVIVIPEGLSGGHLSKRSYHRDASRARRHDDGALRASAQPRPGWSRLCSLDEHSGEWHTPVTVPTLGDEW